MLHLMHDGLNMGGDWLMLFNRIAIGLFFAISGYHKLKDPKNIIATFKADGLPFIGFLRWWVPGVEFLGGLAVLSGILAPLAALGLFIILCVALCTDGPKMVAAYEPSDPADRLDDWLYLSETTYAIMLLFVIAFGPGPYTLVNAALAFT